MSELITKFQGETTWDAFTSHYGLDIVEEDGFLAYLETNGTSPGRCDLKGLQAHYLEWRRLPQDC